MHGETRGRDRGARGNGRPKGRHPHLGQAAGGAARLQARRLVAAEQGQGRCRGGVTRQQPTWYPPPR